MRVFFVLLVLAARVPGAFAGMARQRARRGGRAPTSPSRASGAAEIACLSGGRLGVTAAGNGARFPADRPVTLVLSVDGMAYAGEARVEPEGPGALALRAHREGKDAASLLAALKRGKSLEVSGPAAMSAPAAHRLRPGDRRAGAGLRPPLEPRVVRGAKSDYIESQQGLAAACDARLKVNEIVRFSVVDVMDNRAKPLATADARMAGRAQSFCVFERLRASGLRPTRQRVALCNLIFGAGDRHLSAEELHEEAHKAGEPVSLATVYNTLHQFTDAGLVRPLSGEGSGPISTPTPRTTTTSSWRPTTR